MKVGSRSSPRRMVVVIAMTLLLALAFSLLILILPAKLSLRRPSLDSQFLQLFVSLPYLDNITHTKQWGKKAIVNTYIKGWPYSLHINEVNACKAEEVYLLNTVTSNPSQVYHRSMIRKMWGREDVARKLKVKTIFIVGSVPSLVTQRHLQEESDKYHDIVQFDFLETRRNLTIKSLAAFQWGRAFCPNATWILKNDVDAYTNFWALLQILRKADGMRDGVCARSMVRTVCREAIGGCLPHYVVGKEEYSSDVYPPYCQGYAYVLHRNLADHVLKADSKRTAPPFWLEDVYVTGLLMRNISARWLDIKRRSEVIPLAVRPEYHDGTMLFVHDLEGQVGQGATSYVWQKTLEHYNATSFLLPPQNETMKKTMSRIPSSA